MPSAPNPSDASTHLSVLDQGPVLLYDGMCGFCDGVVRFLLSRDPGGILRFAPLQGPTADAIHRRHPALEGIDSLIWVERLDGDEIVAVRSDAAVRIARYLGGPWVIGAALGWLPSVLRDGGYDAFARLRYRLFGRHDECPVPPASVRARFLP